MKRVRAIFKGRVQGVGFRYTADRIAQHFTVTGYVKNLPDGNVELMVEGDETVLHDFLIAVQTSPMQTNIVETKTEWSEGTGKFKDFGIGV